MDETKMWDRSGALSSPRYDCGLSMLIKHHEITSDVLRKWKKSNLVRVKIDKMERKK